MKVLWFNVSEPSRYTGNGAIIAGWQDSLEKIIKKNDDIDLFVAFESTAVKEKKNIDGVTYIPMAKSQSFVDKIWGKFSWNRESKHCVERAVRVVNEVKPDLIHIFGNEWPFGLIAKSVDVPVVIHIQGSIVSYNNSLYPPGYNELSFFKTFFFHPLKLFFFALSCKKAKSRKNMEECIWETVSHYMGRTSWDFALSRIMSPNSKYYHVDEALRDTFIQSSEQWTLPLDGKIKILTTGISSFWKGPEMLLKTARILKNLNIPFEWNVVGSISKDVKYLVEKTEKISFEECGVRILGFVDQKKLKEFLLASTMYVHTAYIENSPNSICEAQILGLPIVSTNVGGIDTLISNNEDGILVPANDPWRMAYSIISLSRDHDRMLFLSKNAKNKALNRHSPEVIYKQIMDCYESIVNA